MAGVEGGNPGLNLIDFFLQDLANFKVYLDPPTPFKVCQNMVKSNELSRITFTNQNLQLSSE